MWIVKYLNCIRQGHAFMTLQYQGSDYKYCLHCGKIESPGDGRAEYHVNLVPVTPVSEASVGMGFRMFRKPNS